MKNHGKHWRAGKKAHRNSVDGTGSIDTGTPIPIFVASPPANWSIVYPREAPKPPEIPYAGIRAGEIIGHRAWLVINDLQLRSLAHHYIWEPGVTVYGNTREVVDSWSWAPLMGGVYAHSSFERTWNDLKDALYTWYPRQIERPDPVRPTGLIWLGHTSGGTITVDTWLGVVIGTVKMWGDVVEHETGYRAEYAKLVSLDYFQGAFDAEALCRKYGVEYNAAGSAGAAAKAESERTIRGTTATIIITDELPDGDAT